MSLFAAAIGLAALGCDDGAIDKSEQAVRCERIGKRVEDCAGDNYDVGEFRQECVDKSSDDDYQADAKKCDECLDNDNTCAENIAKCAVDCTGIVTLAEASK
jgi:hypothetical protein